MEVRITFNYSKKVDLKVLDYSVLIEFILVWKLLNRATSQTLLMDLAALNIISGF